SFLEENLSKFIHGEMIILNDPAQSLVQIVITDNQSSLLGTLQLYSFENQTLQQLFFQNFHARQLGILFMQLLDRVSQKFIDFLLSDDFLVNYSHDAINWPDITVGMRILGKNACCPHESGGNQQAAA